MKFTVLKMVFGALELCVLTLRLVFKSRHKISRSPLPAILPSPNTGTEWPIYF